MDSRANPAGMVPWLFGTLAVAALIGAVMHFAEFERVAEIARRAQPLWMIVAVLLQTSTYASIALSWRAVLRRARTPRPLRRLFPLAVAKLFADQVIPSAGMGGNLLLVDRLTALGVRRGTAVATLLVSLVGYYAAYAFLAILMLFALWVDSEARPLLVGAVTTFLLVALAIPALALWLRRRGSRPLPPRLESLRPVRMLIEAFSEAPDELVSDLRLLFSVTGFNALVFLADAATLTACLCALGQPVTPGTAFIALMMASIVATLAPIPMGLGSFEATSTAMLAMLGVHVEAALAATLLLRMLTLWLPLIPGLMVLHRQSRRSKRVQG